jgi:tungstate transport system ATP-binding protein
MLDTLALEERREPARVKGIPVLPGEARGLVYRVADTPLIDGIDLTIAGTTLMVVMGPNGAGKSLLLRLLHGLLAPTAGQVLWGGRPLDDELRRRQAMVFQRPVLLRRSALGNLRHALRARGVARAEQRHRAAHALEQAKLLPLAHTPARLLSGGEQQRLALARALSLEPEVLFLDEPTANLDPASTLAIERLIQDAHERGTKIVLVTHDPGQARRLADEIVFLWNGRIEDHGRAPAFFDSPASSRARAFLAGQLAL